MTDVLGSDSSQREARLTATTIAMQAFVWMLWLIWVMTILGIDVSKVLLVPSVGAIFIGFLGRDIMANVLSGLMIYLTQPFAQGDWITLEQGQDGWVREIGIFYTKVVQWDKRPLYVPNVRLIHMLVQNNSRMSHRRIRFDVNVRLQDVPMIPVMVNEIQTMLEDHHDLDTVQHRLVRWREVGDYYATIWISCYTKPTEAGIRLKNYIAVEQSVLERTAAILYKHGADFASSLERFRSGKNLKAEQTLSDKDDMQGERWTSAEAPRSELQERERALRESREGVLKAKEERVRDQELQIDSLQRALAERERQLELREREMQAMLAVQEAAAAQGAAPQGVPRDAEIADAPAAEGKLLVEGDEDAAPAKSRTEKAVPQPEAEPTTREWLGENLQPSDLQSSRQPGSADEQRDSNLKAKEDELSKRSRDADKKLQELSKKDKELSEKDRKLEEAAQTSTSPD